MAAQPAVLPTVPAGGPSFLKAFDDWAARYLAATDPAERAKLVAEGIELARARRPVFKELIKDDPKGALGRAVPMVVRQKLPAEIVALLEARVNDLGVLRVLQGTPMPGEPLPSGSLTFREVELQSGRTYRAYVYGRREPVVTWTANASLNGVAVDAEFAVNESPARILEVGEIPPAGKPAVVDCPVSGKQVFEDADAITEVITAQTPAVETATDVQYFCSTMHIDVLTQTMIMAEGGTGGAFGFTGILPAAPTPALGNVKVIVIPMTYADQNGVPSTEAALYTTLRDVADHYSKASYGRLSLAGIVTPPVKLKHNESWYVNRDTSNGGDISGTSVEMAEAREEARKLGFDYSDYDCTVVRHNGGPQSYGGLGGGSTVWVRGDSVGLWAHEIGHCFGLAHANFWSTAGTSSIGNGINEEYGDSYDIMGNSGSFPNGHYNTQAKNQIRWLPSNFLLPVTQSGLYRIHAYDQGTLDPKRRYALNIVKDSQRTYWGQVHSLFDSTPWMKGGLLLGWRFPNGSGSNYQLIDTTNGSPFLKEDAAISVGSTFSDTESGIHLTTVAANDSPRYVDVQVNFGSFPTNQRPTLALAASATVVPLNATVTFTATAADPEGDTLAYAWQHFGSASVKIASPNAAVITRQFPTAGTWVVTCTVSDMKGGSTTRNVLITVGSATSTYTISGRVTVLGQGLQDVVITANGANGVVTDADGRYTIPNLTANTYTLTPLLYGYTFGELFNNSITVAPNFTGADFEATAQSVVTLAATSPTANELAPVTPGTFRLTRTGDDSQDLVVNVNPALGSATKGSDYTFTPDYTTGSNGFSSFTIPAGADFLDVTLTPVVDATAEGPETAILQLGPGNGYLVNVPSVAYVTIADDDTTLPKISIATTVNAALEGLGTPAVLTLARTGPVTADLTVSYSVTGTAVSGTDYTALSGNALIPVGASTAELTISPLNDSVSELLKNVTVTLASSAAYLVDSTAASATASVYDDDTQTVTVAATDAAAAEVDLAVLGTQANTGTFVITRSGDTAAPLTVYYAFAGTYNTGVMALHGVDYEALPGSVIIPAGQTQASITVMPRFDKLGEGPEQVVLYLGANATNYILGDTGTAVVTITDNAPDLPYIDVVNMSSATEGGSTAVFRITLRGGTGTGALAVGYALSGTAAAGDYSVSGTGNTLTGTSINMNNGATVTKDITITATNDVELEDMESLTLTLSPSATYQTFDATTAATMWLKDNDYASTVYVDTQVGTTGSVTAAEGGIISPVKFYLSRSGSTTAALTVNYTLGGTATNGADYDGDVTYTTATSGVTTTLRDVWGPDPANLWAVGDGGVILKWNGTAWAAQSSGTTSNLLRVWGTDTSNLWAVGATGAIRKWNGTAWAAQTSGTTNTLRSVYGTSASSVWAVGDGGVVLKWNGTAWAAQTSGTTSALNAVWAADANNVWAAGASGTVRYFNGTVWAAQTSGTGTTLNGLWGSGSTSVWAAGNTGTILKWNGTAWAVQPSGSTSTLTAIHGSDASNLYVSGGAGQALVTTTGGAQWSTHGLVSTQTFNGIWRASTGQTWAVGGAGAIVGWNYTSGATLTGSVVIPAGALAVDLPVRVLDDTTLEGAETIVLGLAPGSYSRTAPATMYLSDNDFGAAPTVAFQAPGSAGSEGNTAVSIPVTLSAAQATPVTVEYATSSANSATAISATTHVLPFWVRVVKTGDVITHFESNDGVNWTQRNGTFTVSGLGSTSYLAGIAVASGSASATTASIESFTVTGLSPGGSVGTESAANFGNASPSGTHSFSSGVYSFTTPGSGIATSSTADQCRYVYVPVSNSADCTVTARLLSLGATSTAARLGVMLRASTATGAVYAASLAAGSTGNVPFYTMNRGTLSAASNSPSAVSTPVLPQWFRLTRAGDVFTTAFSKDGTNWTDVGTPQTLPLGPAVMAGPAVSAAQDGLISTAVFDSLTLNVAPLTGLQGRTVGFVNEQGTESLAGGVLTLTGSGLGIANNGDEGHFAATSVTGDFVMTGRLTALSGGNTTAQAGLMLRHSRDGYSRMAHAGFVKSGSIEQRARTQGVTTAFGSGIDFSLPPGVLTFAPGETTQNLLLNVTNDSVDEPDNVVTMQLTNAVGASLGILPYHSYVILDDDAPPASPYVGFAASTSTLLESAGTVSLTVSLSAPATGHCTVSYAASAGTATGGGTDYTLSSGTLAFAAGESVRTVSLTLVDDVVVDDGETIIITLSAPVDLQLGSLAAHTLTITDNDLPVVTLEATDPTAAEAGLDQGTFTFYRTGSTASTLTVPYTTSGTASSATDRQGVGTSVTFAAGSATAQRFVIPLNDAIGEATETTTLTLTAGAGYTLGSPSTATVNILDDDRSTVTLMADDPVSAEGGGPGQFTLTRTAPLNVTLVANLIIAGTATNTTDYRTTGNVALPTNVTFPLNQATVSLPILPVEDSITEGDEQVTLSLSTGSYDIGEPFFGNVNITDNDSPPTLFINSPGSQGPLIAQGNGVIVSATITDDGFPAAVSQTWTQINGPGVASIESPTAATTAVTFSAPGTYILRITATDTQFTVSDQVTVVVGSALLAADWITQDLGPSSARRGQSVEFAGQVTVTGTGAGYAAQSNDTAHVMLRQISGDGTVVARLTSLPTNGALAGLTVRDALTRGARRAVLGYVPGSGLQFRARNTVSTTDSLMGMHAGLILPLWLKLERNAATGDIIASYAMDNAGVPGSWNQLGTTANLTMDAAAQYGLTTTSNNTAISATALFDNVALTPVQTGPALVSEDAGATPTAPGSGSLSSGTYTVVGSTSGYFHGWQYYGDMVVTARLATFSSGAGSASGGIRIAESLENGAQLHLGRMPQGAYNGYYWTSLAGGSGGGVPSSIAAGNWMRIIRRGNSITAYRAPDSGGNPGTWIQIGQPQTVIMTTPVWVGFYVNNSSGVGMNTCTFSGLSIAPLNRAPVVGIANVAAWPLSPVPLDGTLTDDSLPAPVSLTSLWSKRSGPGAVTFGNATLADTTATLAQAGAYVLRLTADDGGAQTFKDLVFTGYTTPSEVWQGQNWVATGGIGDPNAALLQDSDFDGQLNLLEYAFGSAPQTSNASPVTQGTTTVGTDKFLRLTVPKNPAATDVTYSVEATSTLSNPASWSSAGLVIESSTSTQLIVRDTVPLSGDGVQRFMRVRVQRVP